MKELKDRLGLTQAQLAFTLKTDRSEVGRMERGKVPEWLEKAVRLNYALTKAIGLTHCQKI